MWGSKKLPDKKTQGSANKLVLSSHSEVGPVRSTHRKFARCF